MCGICGVWEYGATRGDVRGELLTSMSRVMRHRGPDDAGELVFDEARGGFGFRRLSIIDLSEAGHQPMHGCTDRVWLVFNGEIYNHATLREDLERRGHVYASRTDSETILHLYEERGLDFVQDLEGDYAIALWDEERARLVLVRDRAGVKPLYFYHHAGRFIFGSEIKSMLQHAAITPEVNEEALYHYLTFVTTPAPQTLFRGVQKLPAGHMLVIDRRGEVAMTQYWDALPSSMAVELTASEHEQNILNLLRDSIRKRMMADVPFGVFLSGGVDSSANVALMSELMTQPVRTYSVAFERYEKYNELDYARRIAKQYGADHHEIVIDSDDLEAFVPELVHHQDEPLADWVCVPLRYVSKLARDDGTIVVQIGEGSDELFHGYQKYIDALRSRERFWERVQRVPRPVRIAASRATTELARRVGRGAAIAQMLDDAAIGRQPFWGGAICYQGALKQDLLNHGRPHPDSYDIVERLWNEAEALRPGADVLQKMTYLELKQRLAELLLMRVDKMTMSTSVEARVPFLDHDLVEFALALPPRMKVRDGVGKYILKRAAERWLPHDMIYRQKQGFGAPVAEWFRGDLGYRAQREIRESSLAERGLLDLDYLDQLWEAHRRGLANWGLHLWTVYNVSAWHDYWVAGRVLA